MAVEIGAPLVAAAYMVVGLAGPWVHPLVYVLESHRLGLKFLPPTINEPGPQFVARDKVIRVPLTRTKGLTERTIERLLSERKHGAFASMADFHRRMRPLPEPRQAEIAA